MTYKDLIVWQKARKLVKEVYLLVKKLPKEEIYCLSDQIRRAAISVPSNIAEGFGRGSSKDYVHFLKISRGSNNELGTQLILCVDLGYMTEEDIEEIMNLSSEIERMINSLTKKVSESDNFKNN